MNKTKLDLSTEENQIKHMMYQSEKSKAVRLHMEDKIAEAYEAFKTVLVTEKEILGEDHEETMFSRSNMSVMLAQLKRFPEAEKEMREVIQYYRTAHGEDHQKTRAMKKNLANLLVETGRLNDALDLLKTVRTFEKYNSLSADEKTVTLELLGNVYGKLEMWEESLESLKLLKDMLVNQFGEKHSEVKRIIKEMNKVEEMLDTGED